MTVTFNLPPLAAKLYRFVGGFRYPAWMRKLAQRDLDAFMAILVAEGVKVRRPDVVDFKRGFRTPAWSSRGFCTACPRDGYIVVGDEIIESPMCWRTRYFEGDAYRSLFKEYFRAGARWTSAPRPQLLDDLYSYDYRIPAKSEEMRYTINEWEPVFDAADFVRCGRDLFVTISNVTNRFGVEWLRRHLGDGFRIHEIPSLCRQPMHIDSTFMPLAPGKVLVNPDYCDIENLPPALKRWDILVAPRPRPGPGRDGQDLHVLALDLHQRSLAHRHQGRRGPVAADPDQGPQGLGLRSDPLPVPGLWTLRRRVPLRHPRRAPARDARILLLRPVRPDVRTAQTGRDRAASAASSLMGLAGSR